MTDYCSDKKYNSVPDPYYGGAAGFELVLDILEDACKGFDTRASGKVIMCILGWSKDVSSFEIQVSRNL